MTEKDFLKIKALKEKHNVSWTKLMAYANKIIEKDAKNTE